MVKKILLVLAVGFLALLVGLNIWGAATLGTFTPSPDAYRDPAAKAVVMIFGATGSVGDGLLKAAMQDDEVEKIYAVSK